MLCEEINDKNVLESNNKIQAARELLKQRLINNISLHGYDEQKNQVYNIIKRTILNGESDSFLLVGPKGCGKTTLVSSCLEDLVQEYGNILDYVVISLNGLVHTDDSLALKSIIQQLKLEELNGDRISGSFSDNLFFVLQTLHSVNRNNSKSIIFVLDEFHLFCGHRNQTLLYNLFDVAQSAQAPICVIGVTSRIDITEMLEKRVKSRFSHRQIMLFSDLDISNRLSLIIKYLSLPEEHELIIKPLDKKFIQYWNGKVLEVFKSKKIIQYVKRQLDFDPNERSLKICLLQIISKISKDKSFITEQSVEQVVGNIADQRVESLKDLSVLEFCLVIAMSHHTEIFDGDPFNFEMIYKRYTKFASQNQAAQITKRPIVLKGFERLAELEVIIPISCGNKVFKKEYQLYNLFVTKTQVTSAVHGYAALPTDVTQWAASTIFNL